MATFPDSCAALRLLLGGEETGLEAREEIDLLVMSCANVIVHTILTITNGDVQAAQEGLRALTDDMNRAMEMIGRTVQ